MVLNGIDRSKRDRQGLLKITHILNMHTGMILSFFRSYDNNISRLKNSTHYYVDKDV